MGVKQRPFRIPSARSSPEVSFFPDRYSLAERGFVAWGEKILLGQIRQEAGQNGRASVAWRGRCFLLTAALTGGLMAGAAAAASQPQTTPQPEATPQLENSPLVTPDYSDRTDLELTDLGVRWDELSGPERNALLREVKLRMAQRKDRDGVLMIRTQRRYGRIYRSEDGRYLKIETKVVRVRPAPDQSQGGFGVGFEQRTASTDDSEAADEADSGQVVQREAQESPPVLRVNGTSQ
jgi:hypothetical protein